MNKAIRHIISVLLALVIMTGVNTTCAFAGTFGKSCCCCAGSSYEVNPDGASMTGEHREIAENSESENHCHRKASKEITDEAACKINDNCQCTVQSSQTTPATIEHSSHLSASNMSLIWVVVSTFLFQKTELPAHADNHTCDLPGSRLTSRHKLALYSTLLI